MNPFGVKEDFIGSVSRIIYYRILAGIHGGYVVVCKASLREKQKFHLADSAMLKTKISDEIPPVQSARVVQQCWALMLLLAAAVIWRPLAAYPGSGRWLWLLWGLFMLTAVLLRSRVSGGLIRVALGGGLLFGAVLFAWGRWAFAGFPFAGADGITTLFAAVIAGIAAHGLLGAAKATDGSADLREKLLNHLLAAFALGALMCGLHAMAQRWYIYDRMYADLMSDLAGAPPDALQAGLLHHFKLKRVASVWGDPNALGAFLALGFIASVALLFLRRCGERHWFLLILAVVAALCALAGIWFSGSRGAILDLVVGLAIFSVGIWAPRRGTHTGGGAPSTTRKATVAVIVLLAIISMMGQKSPSASQAPLPATTSVVSSAPSGWKSVFSRSDTIRERVYYAQTGWRIFSTSPIVGAGPGAVDLLYARYKPVEARESKYLHNYVLQIGAEYGLVGLTLALLGFAALSISALRLLRRGGVTEIAIVAMTAMLLADGLYQLSFNQRELMMLFGILAGTLVASAPSQLPVPANSRRTAYLIGSILIFALSMQAGFAMLTSLHARRQAEVAFDVGRPEKAVGLLHRARRWAPRDPQSYTLEAHFAASLHGVEAALPLLKRAIELQPASASLRSMLGAYLDQAGRRDEAIKCVRQAVDLYPTKADYRHQLALLLAQAGTLDQAVEQARLAVKLAYLFENRYEATLEKLLKEQEASRTHQNEANTSGTLTEK